MKVQDTMKIERDHTTDRLRVKILGKVDGYMNREDAPKLDDILNSRVLNYDEKIDAIKELVDEC